MKTYKLDKDIIKEIGEKAIENGIASDYSMAVSQIMYFWALISIVTVPERVYEQLPNIMQPMFRELTKEEYETYKQVVVDAE